MILRLTNIVDTVIEPALRLLPPRLDTPKARVLLMAIGLQESRFEHRYQVLTGGGKGPARGFWQFEEGTKASRGGVCGVFMHSATTELLRLLCRDQDCSFDPRAIWSAIETDDLLAAGLARLMLLTNPAALPEVGEGDAAWDYYLTTWRPGKPRPDSWPELYARAVATVTS